MISERQGERLDHIDVVRWQDGEIHVLGRREETASADGSLYSAYHTVHDARTGEIIREESFRYIGNFPLFMCGCYILTCDGVHPPSLNHELALITHENRIKADRFDSTMREFKEANVNDLRKLRSSFSRSSDFSCGLK